MKTTHQPVLVHADSSVAHGGKQLGTISYLRRERFLAPGGPEEIPVISGNALRGVLRDVGARMAWESLDRPLLPMAVADVLWSGGSLVKAKGEPVTGGRLAEVRSLVPHVGLFGCAGGGRLVEGSLSIGKLLPICAETVPFLPPAHADHPHTKIEMFDLLQVEEYSRSPSRDLLTQAAESGEETAAEGTFRYGAETFISGTVFSTWWSLTNASESEHSLLDDIFAQVVDGLTVGGRGHTGHGRVRFLDLPPRQSTPLQWAEPAAEDVPRAREVLRWLG